MNRFLLRALVVVVILVWVTACATPTPGVVEVTRIVEQKGETVVEQVVVTATPGVPEEKITLLVWDQFGGELESVATELIYANFMRKYPNIEIRREVVGRNDLLLTARTALASGTGPDVVYHDVSPTRELIDAGLILPLDEYADQYRWRERFYATGLSWTIENGKLWGLGLEAEFVGIFYNQSLFDKEGMEVPQTISEALAFCREAKARGYVPMAHSQSEGWQTFFSFTMPAHNYVGVEYIKDLLFGCKGRWDSPEIIEAMKITYEQMKEAGCFVEDLNALDFGGAIDLFNNEEAFMLPTGTWVVNSILELSKEREVKMMPWFDMETGQPRAYTMGMGSAWYVSANTKHPNEAALFLDYLFSDEAVKIWIEAASRIPPVPVDTTQLNLLPLQAFVLNTLEQAGTGQAEYALGWDVDLIVPEQFNTMLSDGWQAVWAGTKTVEEQMADLQQIWEEFGPCQ